MMKRNLSRLLMLLCILSLFAGCACAEPAIIVPQDYTLTGMLPVYRAVKQDFSKANIDPAWLNTSGISQRTEGKNNYTCVVFNDEAKLEWQQVSLYYTQYHGTVDIEYELENGQKVTSPQPKPTMASAASSLASWMLYGWPETNEVYALENQRLSGITLDAAKAKVQALLDNLGMEGYVCDNAIDMPLDRIRTMGEKWNALIEKGALPSNPLLDYSQATAADEGYLLLYHRYGNDGDLGGMFQASFYVTANGFAYVNICEEYAKGDVYAQPDKLVDWQSVAAALPEALAEARYPMTLKDVQRVRLTWCPVRADKASEGMVFTPVWVLSFSAEGAEQGGEDLFAIFDAMDGRLIDHNWM